VSPQTASVDIGALLQVDVTYKPTCNGSHLTDLLVKYCVGVLSISILRFSPLFVHFKYCMSI